MHQGNIRFARVLQGRLQQRLLHRQERTRSRRRSQILPRRCVSGSGRSLMQSVERLCLEDPDADGHLSPPQVRRQKEDAMKVIEERNRRNAALEAKELAEAEASGKAVKPGTFGRGCATEEFVANSSHPSTDATATRLLTGCHAGVMLVGSGRWTRRKPRRSQLLPSRISHKGAVSFVTRFAPLQRRQSPECAWLRRRVACTDGCAPAFWPS